MGAVSINPCPRPGLALRTWMRGGGRPGRDTYRGGSVAAAACAAAVATRDIRGYAPAPPADDCASSSSSSSEAEPPGRAAGVPTVKVYDPSVAPWMSRALDTVTVSPAANGSTGTSETPCPSLWSSRRTSCSPVIEPRTVGTGTDASGTPRNEICVSGDAVSVPGAGNALTASAWAGAEADAETLSGEIRAQARASADSTPSAERVLISSPPKPSFSLSQAEGTRPRARCGRGSGQRPDLTTRRERDAGGWLRTGGTARPNRPTAPAPPSGCAR